MHNTRLFNRRIFPASDDPGQLGTFQHNLWLYNGPRFEGIYNSTIFLTRKLRFICVNAITIYAMFTIWYGFFRLLWTFPDCNSLKGEWRSRTENRQIIHQIKAYEVRIVNPSIIIRSDVLTMNN